ncbi:MAG: Na/Pi cotransporter family protein [Deltaproteobacteria bacterium]|nr:Na/Pi cotransporter family protein [Deltaproteobacteria bacterium]
MNESVLLLFGGLAVFVHGLSQARESLQLLAGDRLRSLIAAFSSNRIFGLVLGAAVTVILQSSTATTTILVGYCASGLCTLEQAMAVILGADVGTTATVQLVSLQARSAGLVLAAAGVAVRYASKKKRSQYVGQALLGLGLLFFGMELMRSGAKPLAAMGAAQVVTSYLSGHRVAGAFLGALLTLFLRSSAPTLALTMALADAGALDLWGALPVLLGANLGTTVSPFASAVDQDTEGKRVALAHLLFKAIGVVVALPLLGKFVHLADVSAPQIARQIANAHTLFNGALALAFLPTLNLGALLLRKLYKPPETKPRFRPKFLDPRALETPALAFGQATREYLRMAEIVGEMLKDSLEVFRHQDLQLLAKVEARDDQVDILNREIRFYLARMGQDMMSPEQAEKQMTLITLTADLESVGDILNRNLLAMGRKKISQGLWFSEDGWKEIEDFFFKVIENFELAVAAFSTGDEELARKVQRHRVRLAEIEDKLKQAHIARLHKGLRESLDTSSIHLDLLAALRRINGLLSNMADAVVRERDPAAKLAAE